jgi:hypothetical protein
MEIEAWYYNNFESLISGRYVTLEHLKPLLKKYNNYYEISILGVSELGKEIPMIKLDLAKELFLLGHKCMETNQPQQRQFLIF